MKNNHSMHVLMFREGDWWVAQCLEIDLAAQAKTIDGLVYELGRVIVGTSVIRIENGLPGIEELPPAPEFYWKAYQRAMTISPDLHPRFQSSVGVPPAFMIPQIEMRVGDSVAR